jgi:hypothetical protein
MDYLLRVKNIFYERSEGRGEYGLKPKIWRLVILKICKSSPSPPPPSK